MLLYFRLYNPEAAVPSAPDHKETLTISLHTFVSAC